jgi:anti-sigma B factor antagonist
MVLHIRIDEDRAILSNFGRIMNDPRYADAAGEVAGLLDQGLRKFILELSALREMGAPALGLLMTLTRQVRQRGGEVVLARVSPEVEDTIETMRMDTFWDVFASVEEATEFYRRPTA